MRRSFVQWLTPSHKERYMVLFRDCDPGEWRIEFKMFQTLKAAETFVAVNGLSMRDIFDMEGK